MSLVVTPLHPLFAAQVTGVDLRQPLDEATRHAIEHAMDAHAVCVLPGQRIEDEHQVAFARHYGPLELSPPKQDKNGVATYNTRVRLREIFDISNLDENGNILEETDARSAYRLGNELWHTDSSFRQKSATWSMLHARMIPPAGGNTEFVDTRAAYDALPDVMKARLEGLVAEHSIWHSRAKHGGYQPTEEERKLRPGAQHYLVRRHPGSGRNCLYVASHASHIIGMPLEEGQALLQELIEFATQPRFIFSHAWSVGDLVIWDNRATMHRATPFAATGHKRDMRRTTIIDLHADMPATLAAAAPSALAG
jgi:alpha-ketoglutarate-dependent 2,4-dichlorophenoxyacetate dioxygenase